jgi:hypothetical protein
MISKIPDLLRLRVTPGSFEFIHAASEPGAGCCSLLVVKTGRAI